MNRSLVALGFMLASPMAFAITCASPGPTIPTTPFNGAGNTCGAADEFGQACSGSVFAAGPSNIHQLNVGNANNFTVSVTPSGGYDVFIAVIGPGCGPAAPCVADADDAGPDAAETVTVTGATPGTYYLLVDSTAAAAGPLGCGPYTVSVTGTLPVELQSFSVD